MTRLLIAAILLYAFPLRAQPRPQSPLRAVRIENQTLRDFEADSFTMFNIRWMNTKWIHAWVHMFTLDHASIRDLTVERSDLPGMEWRNVSFINGSLAGNRIPRLRVIDSYVRNVSFAGAKAPVWKVTRSSFIDCDFRGADLSNGIFLLSRFDGSVIDSKTALPLTREMAAKLGFRYVP